MTDQRAVRSSPSRREHALLLFTVLGAPVGWTVHLFGSFFYASAACAGAPMWGVHLLTVGALGVVTAVAFFGAQLWRGNIHPAATYRLSAQHIGVMGLALAAFFAALIFMEAWPSFVTDPCVGLGVVD